MKQSFSLKMGQGLTMTPALQQAIRLLQLSSLDLQAEIQQAVDSNVMLELEENEPEATPEEVVDVPAEANEDSGEETFSIADTATDLNRNEIPEEMPVDAEWSDTFDTTASVSSSGSTDEELHDLRQANLHSGTSLYEHLAWQARLAPLGEWQAEVAAYLIDAINDDGYLENWDEACEHFRGAMGLAPEQMERVLRVVQDFDPPGVAARDLAECLRLQLQQLQQVQPTSECLRALTIVNSQMALLARRDVAALQAALDTDAENVESALALIQTLQPRPGQAYQAQDSGYLAPDVVVRKHQGRWKVSLNPEVTPRIRINPHYLGMVKRADTSRDQLTMKQHLLEARYFISAVESRNDTLLRVAQTIVEEQRAFLEYGDEAMRPLVLRDISERLGIHESTVSRATANKTMLTPRGLYELKFFFSSHVQTLAGGTCSATAIQAMIKRLVTAEDRGQPLSDGTLAELLLKDGIRVARRTVAKYREAMGIAPSQERRPT